MSIRGTRLEGTKSQEDGKKDLVEHGRSKVWVSPVYRKSNLVTPRLGRGNETTEKVFQRKTVVQQSVRRKRDG